MTKATLYSNDVILWLPPESDRAVCERLALRFLTLTECLELEKPNLFETWFYPSQSKYQHSMGLPLAHADALALPLSVLIEPSEQVYFDRVGLHTLFECFINANIAEGTTIASLVTDSAKAASLRAFSFRAFRALSIPPIAEIILGLGPFEIVLQDDLEVALIARPRGTDPFLFDGKPASFWNSWFCDKFSTSVQGNDEIIEIVNELLVPRLEGARLIT